MKCFVNLTLLTFEIIFKNINICDYLHDESSPVKIRAFALATCMQCSRGLCLRLLLIRAETAPSLDMPNHVYTNSAQLGMKTQTTSPRVSPTCSCMTRATRLELSAICKMCTIINLSYLKVKEH